MPNLTNLAERIIKLLEKGPRQLIQRLATKLNVSRTFLSGYLLALKKQEYVRPKKIGTAKVYFIYRPARR